MKDYRYYQKGNPEKVPLENITKKKSAPTNSNGNIPPIQNPAYIKPEATLQPKAYIIIFSGGTERERDYFYLIERNPLLYPDIKIEFFAEPNFEKGGKPLITKVAIEKTHEYQESSSSDNPDSFWLLTDVDHFEQFLTEMKKDCDANGINLIISNSCFEVWLYYSEKSDKCIGFNIPKETDKISLAFKTWTNMQIKGGLKPNKAILNIEQNITNAKQNYSEKDGIPSLFSTQMFRLAEMMLPYIKYGNEKILSRKNTQRK